jgi:hypothetical protein
MRRDFLPGAADTDVEQAHGCIREEVAPDLGE